MNAGIQNVNFPIGSIVLIDKIDLHFDFFNSVFSNICKSKNFIGLVKVLTYNKLTHSVSINQILNMYPEDWAGKIALISNIEEDPKGIFLMWKSRDEIEKLFHILQNILELDTPYASKESIFKGYVFATFIALFLYYKVLNLLKSNNINKKFSVADVCFELSKIMIYEKNGLLLEAPKRTWNLIDKTGIKDIITKNAWS